MRLGVGFSIAELAARVSGGPVFDFMGGALPAGVTFTRAGSATYFDAAGVLQTALADMPRFDHNPVSGALRGLLVEPSATNLITHSSDLSAASWTKSGAGSGTAPVVTPNYATAPDGTMTADRVVMALNGGTTAADISSIAAPANGISPEAQAAPSIWIKTTDGSTKTVQFRDDMGVSYSRLLTVTGNWTRFDAPAAASGNSNTVRVLKLWLRGTQGTSDSADLLVWGGQFEVGSARTSYIPTSGAAATLAADQPIITANLGTRDVRVTTEAGVQVLTAQALTGSYWPALTGPQCIRKIEVL